jgi:hypothetical protein
MKLRIKGSSIRLRLTEPEVRTLASVGALEESVRFPDGATWRYRLERVASGPMRAGVKDSCLCVGLPADEIEAWAGTDRVGIDASIPLSGGGTLAILIEKDFECLHPRAGEPGAGAYPHPAKGPVR